MGRREELPIVFASFVEVIIGGNKKQQKRRRSYNM